MAFLSSILEARLKHGAKSLVYDGHARSWRAAKPEIDAV